MAARSELEYANARTLNDIVPVYSRVRVFASDAEEAR